MNIKLLRKIIHMLKLSKDQIYSIFCFKTNFKYYSYNIACIYVQL